MKEIKNQKMQERQKYVPASVKVITASVQRVICTSLNEDNTKPGEMGGEGGNVF